jgi:hypothetical protein
MDQQRSTLRFPFVAAAEIAPESSPSASITASVKELSLHGLWFAKTLADFEINDIAALPPLFCYNS